MGNPTNGVQRSEHGDVLVNTGRSEELKARWLEDWHFKQRIFDLINDSMPQRYKMKLENRSYREGASREGKTLLEFAEDRKLPKSKRKWGDYVGD